MTTSRNMKQPHKVKYIYIYIYIYITKIFALISTKIVKGINLSIFVEFHKADYQHDSNVNSCAPSALNMNNR